MDKQSFLVLLDELLELPSGTLRGPEKLDDLESWDSMATVGFIALANEHCDVTLSPRQIAASTSIDELLALLPLA